MLLSMMKKLTFKGELWLQTSDGGDQRVIGLAYKNDSYKVQRFVEVKLAPKTVQGVGVGGTRWLHTNNLKHYEIVKREEGGHLLRMKQEVDPQFRSNALRTIGESADTDEPIIVSMLRKLLAAGEKVYTTWVSHVSSKEYEAKVQSCSIRNKELVLFVSFTVRNQEVENVVSFHLNDPGLKLKKFKRGWWIDDTW